MPATASKPKSKSEPKSCPRPESHRLSANFLGMTVEVSARVAARSGRNPGRRPRLLEVTVPAAGADASGRPYGPGDLRGVFAAAAGRDPAFLYAVSPSEFLSKHCPQFARGVRA